MVSVPSFRARFARPLLARRPLAGAITALSTSLLLLAISAAPALADSPFSWSPPVAISTGISSNSCLPSSLCVGFDGAGSVTTSTNPTGGSSAWSYPAWVDDPPEVESTHAVSCTASPSLLCAAVDLEGHVVTSTNPTDSQSWHVENLLSSYNFAWGISCPSSSLCVAVSEEEEASEGHGQVILSSVEPTGSQADWKRVLPLYEKNKVGTLFGVSCPSTTFCVAVGQVGLGGGILTSNNPTGEAKAWSGATIDVDEQFLFGVSCASTSLCVTYNGKGTVFTSTEPTGGPSQWNPADIDGENELTGISCTSSPSTLCVATDNQGNVITSTNPTGGPSAWTVTNVDAGNRLESVSCASTSLCVASDGAGNILTAPFTASTGGGPTPNPPKPAPTPAPTLPPAPHKESVKCKKGFKKKAVHGKAKCVKVKKKHKKH